MATNRKIISGNILVVHEGMQNVLELKEKLIHIRDKINEVLLNEERHLADVGLLINVYGNQMIELSGEVFEAHKVEKNSLNPQP